MSPTVIAVVLFAALLHATWNFLVKRAADPYLGMAAVVLGRVPYGLAALIAAPAVPAASYGYIVLGALLHVGYQLFLQHSYRFGELSQVYPMARGSAPLIVAAVSLSMLGVRYDGHQLAALALIVGGLVSLGAGGLRSAGARRFRAGGLAVGAGAFIAAYSLVDGFGARTIGSALGYYGSMTVLNAALYCLVMVRVRPGLAGAVLKGHLRRALAGGGASFIGYALVIWAFTREPIALVTSLRETSIVFSVLLGVVILKERFTAVKAVAVLATLTGVVVLRLGG